VKTHVPPRDSYVQKIPGPHESVTSTSSNVKVKEGKIKEEDESHVCLPPLVLLGMGPIKNLTGVNPFLDWALAALVGTVANSSGCCLSGPSAYSLTFCSGLGYFLLHWGEGDWSDQINLVPLLEPHNIVHMNFPKH